ncbi:predicted protein [Postia placenta Mad-698-R]|nr:predicted protein [Postia placenta Mad-698-R]
MSGYIHSPEPTVQSWVQFKIPCGESQWVFMRWRGDNQLFSTSGLRISIDVGRGYALCAGSEQLDLRITVSSQSIGGCRLCYLYNNQLCYWDRVCSKPGRDSIGICDTCLCCEPAQLVFVNPQYATITPKVTVNPQLGCVAVVASRPSLRTVMFRDGTSYFWRVESADSADYITDCSSSTITLLNSINIVVYTLLGDYTVPISAHITRGRVSVIINTVFAFYSLSSILISRFLIHIRQAADRAARGFSSQSSLSFTNSQPDSSLSTAEFAADMAHNTVQDDDPDSAFDLDDDNNDIQEERDEEDGIEDEESGIELQELSPTARSST